MIQSVCVCVRVSKEGKNGVKTAAFLNYIEMYRFIYKSIHLYLYSINMGYSRYLGVIFEINLG